MKRLFWVMVAVSLSFQNPISGQDAHVPATTSQDLRVFREPFTLRVRVDKDHYYEEHYDKRIPYVSDNDVYLFSGENFGVTVQAKDDGTASVTYQPDIAKADVWLTFAQPKQLGAGMMLTIQNKLKRRLQVDALMTVPGKEEIYKTSILPIEAGLSDFESWPHPIVQLVLRNFRLSDSQMSKPKH